MNFTIKSHVETIEQIVARTRGCMHVEYRPAKQQRTYHAIESLDLSMAGSVIEQATKDGLTGSKIEDTGLAAYIYWESLPWQ